LPAIPRLARSSGLALVTRNGRAAPQRVIDELCLWSLVAGYALGMLTIILIVLLVLLLTGGIGYSRRGRRL
jgi:hypothetical protein